MVFDDVVFGPARLPSPLNGTLTEADVLRGHIARLAHDNAQLNDNLTAVQKRCTELLEENRRLRAHAMDDLMDSYPAGYLMAMQADHKQWSTRNFPDADPIDAVLGVAEEVGELCHAILKQRQGIRGTKEEHEAKAKDAVGDIVIFLLDVCNRRGWSFAEIVAETWAEVRKRDWTKKGGGE